MNPFCTLDPTIWDPGLKTVLLIHWTFNSAKCQWNTIKSMILPWFSRFLKIFKIVWCLTWPLIAKSIFSKFCIKFWKILFWWLREYQQKKFIMLSRFWMLRGWGRGLSESIKKGKFVTKILFQIILKTTFKHVKNACIFHLILIAILSILILSVKNSGQEGEGSLTDKIY